MLIVIVVFISGIASFIISNKIFATPASRQEKVEVVEPITSNFKTPLSSDKYFNSNSFDPSQTIHIGDNNNNQPFNKQ